MARLTAKAFFIYWLPVLVWLGIIAVESTGSFSSQHTSRFVVPILHWLFPSASMKTIEAIHDVGRKVGHFVGYGLMGYLFFRAIRGSHHVFSQTLYKLRSPDRSYGISAYWRAKWAGLALLCTALVASADEIHQRYLPGRGPSFHDVVLDTFGAAIFLLLVFYFTRRKLNSGTEPAFETR